MHVCMELQGQMDGANGSQIEDTPQVIYALGVCLHQTGKPDQAVEYLRWVINEDEDHLEARLRLANVLEEQGHKAEALEIVTEGQSLYLPICSMSLRADTDGHL